MLSEFYIAVYMALIIFILHTVVIYIMLLNKIKLLFLEVCFNLLQPIKSSVIVQQARVLIALAIQDYKKVILFSFFLFVCLFFANMDQIIQKVACRTQKIGIPFISFQKRLRLHFFIFIFSVSE